MTLYQLEISGAEIVDKFTHYEAYSFIGPEMATVVIRGDIATEFQKMYGLPITEAESFRVSVDMCRNDSKIEECQDVFKPCSYLSGAISSVDDIDFIRG